MIMLLNIIIISCLPVASVFSLLVLIDPLLMSEEKVGNTISCLEVSTKLEAWAWQLPLGILLISSKVVAS